MACVGVGAIAGQSWNGRKSDIRGRGSEADIFPDYITRRGGNQRKMRFVTNNLQTGRCGTITARPESAALRAPYSVSRYGTTSFISLPVSVSFLQRGSCYC